MFMGEEKKVINVVNCVILHFPSVGSVEGETYPQPGWHFTCSPSDHMPRHCCHISFFSKFIYKFHLYFVRIVVQSDNCELGDRL